MAPSKQTTVIPLARPPTTAWMGKVSQPTSAATQYTSPGSGLTCQSTLAQVPSRNPATLCTTPFGLASVPLVKIRNAASLASRATAGTPSGTSRSASA
jgi:hypothetical protein